MLFHWLLYLVVISELSVVMDDVWNLQCLHACMVPRELWQLWQDNNVYVLVLLMTLMVTMPAWVPWELCSWSCYWVVHVVYNAGMLCMIPPSGVVLARRRRRTTPTQLPWELRSVTLLLCPRRLQRQHGPFGSCAHRRTQCFDLLSPGYWIVAG